MAHIVHLSTDPSHHLFATWSLESSHVWVLLPWSTPPPPPHTQVVKKGMCKRTILQSMCSLLPYPPSNGPTLQSMCSLPPYPPSNGPTLQSMCSLPPYPPSNSPTLQSMCSLPPYPPSNGPTLQSMCSLPPYPPSNGSTLQSMCSLPPYPPPMAPAFSHLSASPTKFLFQYDNLTEISLGIVELAHRL